MGTASPAYGSDILLICTDQLTHRGFGLRSIGDIIVIDIPILMKLNINGVDRLRIK